MNKIFERIQRGVKEPYRIMRYAKRKIMLLRYKYLRRKHRHRPFREFYSVIMEIRTQEDPKTAVGGMWEQMGSLQFNFLVEQGLRPDHKLLDLGCGSLRGGIHFIEYLDEGNYFGMDISRAILEAGKNLLIQTSLEYKKPVLRNNTDLKFDDFPGEAFDYILAQSVFTHMPIEDIEECFQNIHKVMHKNTLFFATFHDGGDRCFVKHEKDFFYPFSILREIADRYGYQAELVKGYAHPRKQRMIKVTIQKD